MQPGNTLFQIALAVGSSLSELREANCLANADRITSGDVLWVPRLPVGLPVAGGTSLPGSVTGSGPVGCTTSDVTIVSPFANASLSGVVNIIGTAIDDDFDYYKIEVRPNFSSVYNFYGRYETPVVNGVLGTLNTELFDNGLHWLRLTVVDNTGNYPSPCAIPVIFR